jgi:hypothetical protein
VATQECLSEMLVALARCRELGSRLGLADVVRRCTKEDGLLVHVDGWKSLTQRRYQLGRDVMDEREVGDQARRRLDDGEQVGCD